MRRKEPMPTLERPPQRRLQVGLSPSGTSTAQPVQRVMSRQTGQVAGEARPSCLGSTELGPGLSVEVPQALPCCLWAE